MNSWERRSANGPRVPATKKRRTLAPKFIWRIDIILLADERVSYESYETLLWIHGKSVCCFVAGVLSDAGCLRLCSALVRVNLIMLCSVCVLMSGIQSERRPKLQNERMDEANVMLYVHLGYVSSLNKLKAISGAALKSIMLSLLFIYALES